MNIQKIEIIDPGERILINWHTQLTSEPLHTHEFIEIEYVVNGEGVQIINDVEYQVKRGDVVFLNIGDSHSYYSKNNLQILNCIFYPNLYQSGEIMPISVDNNDTPKIPNFIRLPGDYIIEIENLLHKIEREFEQKSIGYQLILKNYISILLTILARCASSYAIEHKDNLAYAILSYLEDHYMDARLYDVAKYFCFNSTYFSKYFKKTIGTTFSQYVSEKKIQKAIELISNTDDTIESICNKVGYADKKQFYKLFKEYTGMTPVNYRKKPLPKVKNTMFNN